jgi:hypothetical protein
MDAGFLCAGAPDDARPCTLLWRHGAQQERALDVHAQLRCTGHHDTAVDSVRLLARVRDLEWWAHRWPRLRTAQWCRPDAALRSRSHHSAPLVHGLSDDVRHHHARADLRRVRRAAQVLDVHRLHAALGDLGLRPGLPLGLAPRRLALQARRARLCGRHRGAHDGRLQRARVRHRDRQAQAPRTAPQLDDDPARRGPPAWPPSRWSTRTSPRRSAPSPGRSSSISSRARPRRSAWPPAWSPVSSASRRRQASSARCRPLCSAP